MFQQIRKDLKKYSKIFEQKDRLSQSKASKVSVVLGLGKATDGRRLSWQSGASVWLGGGGPLGSHFSMEGAPYAACRLGQGPGL